MAKPTVIPDVNFSDVYGNESLLQVLAEYCYILEYPEFLKKVSDLPKSFLFHGPAGCGKALLASAIAGEYKVPLLSVKATELVGGISGDTLANVRDVFNQAAELSRGVFFIDNVDTLAMKTEKATTIMEIRIVGQLCDAMCDLKSKKLPVVIICAACRPDSLDQELRNSFDMEFSMNYLNRYARHSILQALCQEVQLAEDVSLSAIADLTAGFAGSNLKAIINNSNLHALKRAISEFHMRRQNVTDEGSLRINYKFSPEEINSILVTLTMLDFQKAVAEVKQMKYGDISSTDTTWDDIKGLEHIRRKFDLLIVQRARHPNVYQAIGFEPTRILLVGPPGCDKLAKAVAADAGIDFLHIKEAGKNRQDLVKKARDLAPCIIFFDDINTIWRSWNEDGSLSSVAIEMLMDKRGLEPRHVVHVIASTSRLDCLDPALLRYFQKNQIFHVKPQPPKRRVKILRPRKAAVEKGTVN